MRLFLTLIAVVVTGISCGSGNETQEPATSALDAGRSFIDDCLKGRFKQAAFYMIKDDENVAGLAKLEESFNSKGSSDKSQYKQASIMIENVETVNDSTTILSYRNSFDRIARKLKVIKRQETWLVDFKYTFSGNM
ncbi:hypothetical protein [Filimonas effusa]|uniref:DUF4878 domain-containing protein n=1 Tax=Filimonas effusa TaxID=2508721 RepID=A0A4Q1DB49_9BACT|nr:hypothetical protein [Filimonas effusa]RXK86674.1 hypothetical protein ESB13_07675 [Filimonas effusa]